MLQAFTTSGDSCITNSSYICIISFTRTEKLPDDPRLRKKRLIEKQKFARYHRLYGDSLSGDIGLAKTIIVTNTNAEKKKGKKKEGKVVSVWYSYEFLIQTFIFVLFTLFTWVNCCFLS